MHCVLYIFYYLCIRYTYTLNSILYTLNSLVLTIRHKSTPTICSSRTLSQRTLGAFAFYIPYTQLRNIRTDTILQLYCYRKLATTTTTQQHPTQATTSWHIQSQNNHSSQRTKKQRKITTISPTTPTPLRIQQITLYNRARHKPRSINRLFSFKQQTITSIYTRRTTRTLPNGQTKLQTTTSRQYKNNRRQHQQYPTTSNPTNSSNRPPIHRCQPPIPSHT